MIGKLTGTIDSVGEDFVILDVHGVGYLVHCSARTLQARWPFPRLRSSLIVLVHTSILFEDE